MLCLPTSIHDALCCLTSSLYPFAVPVFPQRTNSASLARYQRKWSGLSGLVPSDFAQTDWCRRLCLSDSDSGWTVNSISMWAVAKLPNIEWPHACKMFKGFEKALFWRRHLIEKTKSTKETLAALANSSVKFCRIQPRFLTLKHGAPNCWPREFQQLGDLVGFLRQSVQHCQISHFPLGLWQQNLGC